MLGTRMTVTVILGAQFGDEAKGKIADFLAERARYVVRTGGGPNAGHSIHLSEGSVVLHQLSVGVLRHGVTGVDGPGMVIDPFGLEDEIQELDQKQLLKGRIVLSDRAHVILPVHRLEDAWEERVRQAESTGVPLGTTMRGIGPAYADRAGRWGLRFADLARPAALAERLKLIYATKAHLTDRPPYEEMLSSLTQVGERLAPMVAPTEPMLWEAARRGDHILLEGAQSALLDVDFGTAYPFVTSSHPTAAGALVGSGLPPQELDEVLGVAKAYATRVGAGPFPTEEEGPMGEYLRREGKEHGATTGRPRRCGWLDLVLLRYAARLNGFTSLAITKVDILGGLDEVPVCVGYQDATGQPVPYPPTLADDFARLVPVYRKMPGWPQFNERLKDRLHRDGAHALPPTLRRFLGFIADETGVPIEYVGYGPRRDETIWLGRGRKSVPMTDLAGWKT